MVDVLKGYELHERIGTGGFGAVYRAYQPLLGREVAVKAILPEHANHPDFVRRFEAEAQLIARLEHPHIVPLYDYWRDPDGAYLVMRWIRGGSLAQVLAAGRWNIERATTLLEQIASALHFAHRAGVVHRDIKPDNILIGNDGEAYLTDFGIAQMVGQEVNDEHDSISGSINYIAPEQLRSGIPVPQTDIYALGLVIYEALTGEHVFKGSTFTDIVTRHLFEPIPNICELLPQLSEEANNVLQKACAKDPAERYETALEFARAFRQAVTPSAPSAEELPDDALLVNPYKGLRPFEQADSDDFYGREMLVDDLVSALEHSRFLAVVGPSGSGKSSVVSAGVLPRLRHGALDGSADWYMVEMVPGSAPLSRLEAALLSVAFNPPSDLMTRFMSDSHSLVQAVERVLGGAGSQLVLFIDQFEEVFTLCDDETEREQFLRLLTTAADAPDSRLRVIVTLRADFYDRPLYYEGFGALMQSHTQVVLPMSADEVERAITMPATQAGAIVDTDLVAQIVSDVRSEPGALPLLQYALTELFEKREGRRLTLYMYRLMGGVAGALAKRADEVYDALPASQQALARQIFLRLVTLGEGSEDTRRRTPRAELASLGEVARVLDAFGAARLLTFDNEAGTRAPMVEVAHEALLRTWGRLRAWLDESRGDLRQQRLLAAAAHDWTHNNRTVDYLLTGTRLAQFAEWAAGTSVALTPGEREYLQASVTRQQAVEHEEAARRAREEALERRNRSILRALVGVMASGIVIALVLTAFAISRQNEAIAAQNEAVAQAATATVAQGQALIQAQAALDARATSEANAAELQAALDRIRSSNLADSAVQAFTRGDLDTAIVLAFAANQIQPPPEQAQRSLAQIAPEIGTRLLLQGHERDIQGLAYSPDGRYLISGALDRRVIIWDTRTGQQVRTLEGHEDIVLSIATSPDGRLIASGDGSGTVLLWHASTGERLTELVGHTNNVYGLGFSADSQRLISASTDRQLILWDIASGDIIRQYGDRASTWVDVELSPDGSRIAGATQAGQIIIWDAASGAQTLSISTGSQIGGIAYHADGARLVSANSTGSLTLWDATTGAALNVYNGHTGRVVAVQFSADGQQIASGGADNTVRLWNTQTGQILRTYKGHRGRVRVVAFSSEGVVASGSGDNDVRVWLSQPIPLNAPLVLSGHRDVATQAVFTPDNRFVLSGSGTLFGAFPDDARMLLWDWEAGTLIREFSGHSDSITSVAVSPDGATALSASRDGTVMLWDLATGEALRTFVGHDDWVWSVVYSPDGTQALSASRDTTLILWDVTTGAVLRRFVGHDEWVNAGVFSPDASRIVSASDDGRVIVWDATSGEPLQALSGHNGPVHDVAVSPDGRTILSGSSDQSALLWDAASGEVLASLFMNSAVNGVGYSGDGQTLLTVTGTMLEGVDDQVTLWDATSGQALAAYALPFNDGNSAAYSPDERLIVVATSNGDVLLYPQDRQIIMDWIAGNVFLRELTCDERLRFGIEPLCSPS
jgi:WD40 repeat protein/serine/threonine protein kinase/nucleoside diphosphate kinase